jgi:hypothetical protein
MAEATKMNDREVRAAIRKPILFSFDLANEEERLICGLIPLVLNLLGVESQQMKRCLFDDGECVRVLTRCNASNRYGVVDFTFKPVGVAMWEWADYKTAFAVYHQVTAVLSGIKRTL